MVNDVLGRDFTVEENADGTMNEMNLGDTMHMMSMVHRVNECSLQLKRDTLIGGIRSAQRASAGVR